MICIRCQHDSKYPDRKDTGSCQNCGGKFAFEPRNGDRLTDKAFQRALDAVSVAGQVKWGVEHLYFELCRRSRSRSLQIAAGIILPGVFTLAAIYQPRAVLFVGPILVMLGYLMYRGSAYASLSRGDFERMWDRWGQIHGKPKGVIVRKPQDARPARAPEPDVGDYSFDRAVICDRARTVDLLLANNFHFENNCAVLSIGGYPQQAFETVRRMLRRNPRLEVFVLHDITPEGCRMAHRLANDPQWFKGTGVRIVDVGLRPIHARPFRGLFLASERGTVEPGEGISPKDARWLSRYTLELAVIRPEQVLKRLFRAMNRPLATGATGASRPGVLGTGTGSSEAGAVGAAAAMGAVASAPITVMTETEEMEQLEELEKKKKGDFEIEVDLDSFSADADASDGGADSFG